MDAIGYRVFLWTHKQKYLNHTPNRCAVCAVRSIQLEWFWSCVNYNQAARVHMDDDQNVRIERRGEIQMGVE